MAKSRYGTSRTLVRRVCRLPGEDRESYRRKIARLREHFERFNVDTADLCQWLMGLRKRFGDPSQPASFGVLGDFLLEPTLAGVEAEETERDRWRLAVFDCVAGIRSDCDLSGHRLPDALKQAIAEGAAMPLTQSAKRSIGRISALERPHRLVLLKSAAEWVVARYQRGMEGWVRRHDEWEKEKSEWEAAHPELTPEVREQFARVFRSLSDPEAKGPQEVTRKNPRICTLARLRKGTDNCVYAGEKGHGPLCWKYAEFVRDLKQKEKKRFWDAANRFAAYCKEHRARPSAALQHPKLADRLFTSGSPQQRLALFKIFNQTWNAYLHALEMTDEKAVELGQLKHCQKIGNIWQKSTCQFNPHTNICKRYKAAIAQLVDATPALDETYRQWRKLYLAGPSKPVFRYPSSRELPMPKVFGSGFHEIDFGRSVLRLRLEGMAEGEWEEFGLIPWPKGYSPSKRDVRVTSVHISFVGTRARAGFRFEVEHRASRFVCAQDSIDELRSRVYPRRSQDGAFLAAAREHLLGSFSGNAGKELLLLAVDLGTGGAAATVYQGRRREKDIPLNIVKIEKLYRGETQPTKQKGGRGPDADSPRDPDIAVLEKGDSRGLRLQHIDRHLIQIAESASAVALHRQNAKEQHAPNAPATLKDHDFRGLKRHIGWMLRDWVRLNAAQIIEAAEANRCDLIVFESMRGVRVPGYEQIEPEEKQRKAMLSYGRIRRKVTEKAVERGMLVCTVPEVKSSSLCSACGHEQPNAGLLRKNKSKRRFECQCGDPKARDKGAERHGSAPGACRCCASLDSDANAARVLARIFLGEIDPPEPTGP